MQDKSQLLSGEILEKIRSVFPSEQIEEVARILITQCGQNLPFMEKADQFNQNLRRVRLSVLGLCKGDMHKLRELVEDAKRDWRDVIVAGGYG